jgi:hypothetical protein
VVAEQQPALPLLLEVLELEAEERHARRITRLRRASKLPPGKTFDTLDAGRLPPAPHETRPFRVCETRDADRKSPRITTLVVDNRNIGLTMFAANRTAAVREHDDGPDPSTEVSRSSGLPTF